MIGQGGCVPSAAQSSFDAETDDDAAAAALDGDDDDARKACPGPNTWASAVAKWASHFQPPYF